MTLKNTINTMKTLLAEITQDLQKADGGNKAASQRVRTGTVKLEKVAKTFRKESIRHDKTNIKRKSGKKASKPAASKTGSAKSNKKSSSAKHKKATSRGHALSFRRRPTAKLPARRAAR